MKIHGKEYQESVTWDKYGHSSVSESGPKGEDWKGPDEEYEAWVYNPLDDLMRSIRKTAGSDEEARNAVQDEINAKGGIKLAFILNELIVDEDILESQPNEELEDVIPPSSWIKKKITIKEILEERHIEDGGEYYGKENLAGNTLLEEQDWAVENITLPRKRN